MLINIVTAWCHHQKDRPLWSTDRAHRFWDLDSWHTRTHENTWCAFCFLALTLLFFFLRIRARKTSVLSPVRRVLLKESTLRLSCFVSPTHHTRQFHVYFLRNCFRNLNFYLERNYICFETHSWQALDFDNLQQSGKRNRTNRRWVILASTSWFCAVISYKMCSYVCAIYAMPHEKIVRHLWYVQSDRANE